MHEVPETLSGDRRQATGEKREARSKKREDAPVGLKCRPSGQLLLTSCFSLLAFLPFNALLTPRRLRRALRLGLRRWEGKTRNGCPIRGRSRRRLRHRELRPR